MASYLSEDDPGPVGGLASDAARGRAERSYAYRVARAVFASRRPKVKASGVKPKRYPRNVGDPYRQVWGGRGGLVERPPIRKRKKR